MRWFNMSFLFILFGGCTEELKPSETVPSQNSYRSPDPTCRPGYYYQDGFCVEIPVIRQDAATQAMPEVDQGIIEEIDAEVLEADAEISDVDMGRSPDVHVQDGSFIVEADVQEMVEEDSFVQEEDSEIVEADATIQTDAEMIEVDSSFEEDAEIFEADVAQVDVQVDAEIDSEIEDEIDTDIIELDAEVEEPQQPDVDGMSGATELLPTLTVRRMELADRIHFEDLDDIEEDFFVNSFQFCAENGDVSFDSVTFHTRGDFWGFPFIYDFENGMQHIVPNNGSTTLLFQGENEIIHLLEGECTYISLTVFIEDLGRLDDLQWLQTDLEHVHTNNANVQYLNSEGDLFWVAEGTKYIFNSIQKIHLYRQDYYPEGEIVTRNEDYVHLSGFTFDVDEQDQGSIQSFEIRASISPEIGNLPIEMFINVRDENGMHTNILEESYIVQDGTLLRWESQRPDGSPEPLNWGGAMSVSFQLLFCDENTQNFRFVLENIEATGLVLIEDFDNDYGMDALPFQTLSDVFEEEYEILNVIIADPSDSEQGNAQLRLNLSAPYNNYYHGEYIWNPMDLSNECQPLEESFDYEVPDDCPIMQLQGLIENTDNRFQKTLEEIDMDLSVSGFPEEGAEILVRISDMAYNGDFVFERNYYIENGLNALFIDESIPLRDDNFNHGFLMQVFLITPHPEFTLFVDGQDPPEIQFHYNSFEVDYSGTVLPAYLWGPDPELRYGAHDYRDLPYDGVELFFAPPTVYVSEHSEGQIEQRIRISEYGGNSYEEIELFYAIFNVPFGSVYLFEVCFNHNTEKQEAPMEHLNLNIRGRNFAQMSWDEFEVCFTPPEDEGIDIYSLGSFDMQMTFARPTVPTDEGLPIQMELSYVGVSVQENHELLVDTIVHGTQQGVTYLGTAEGEETLFGEIVAIIE